MFVRIAWARPDTRTQPGAYRRGVLPARRSMDDLGIPPRDFSKMTRGLFDRQD